MAESYVGEIRMFAGNYAPQGWALCKGQVLSIADYPALFSVIKNTYGGDGRTTFALPDMQGRIPLHVSQNYPLAQKLGVETVTLTTNQLPQHTHLAQAVDDNGSLPSPAGALWAKSPYTSYANPAGNTLANMSAETVASYGGGQSHNNMMPSLVITFIISLNGTNFPIQS